MDMVGVSASAAALPPDSAPCMPVVRLDKCHSNVVDDPAEGMDFGSQSAHNVGLQQVRRWRGVRTQKRLSHAAMRSPTDVLLATPTGMRASRSGALRSAGGGGWAGTPVGSVQRSLRRSAGRHGSRASLRSSGGGGRADSCSGAAGVPLNALAPAAGEQNRQTPRQQQAAEAARPVPPPPRRETSYGPAEGSWFAQAMPGPAAASHPEAAPAIGGGFLAPAGGTATGIFAPPAPADVQRADERRAEGLRDLDDLFAQSPARRLCPERAVAFGGAVGGPKAEIQAQRPAAEEPPVPLPTARKLVRAPVPFPA